MVSPGPEPLAPNEGFQSSTHRLPAACAATTVVQLMQSIWPFPGVVLQTKWRLASHRQWHRRHGSA